MINTFRKAIFKQGYSLIIAAWMFTLSFVISNYWAFNASPQKVKQSFESYLASQEKDFETLTTTTASLHLLLNSQADKSALDLQDKEYGLFVYTVGDSTPPKETYWNTFNMNVSQQDLRLPDGYYPIRANNGLFEMLKKTIPTKTGDFLVVAMIPIRWTYFIESKYLETALPMRRIWMVCIMWIRAALGNLFTIPVVRSSLS
ncbi:hypothetical protein FSB73_18945 [Arachidicoccus ginsenosidivorans]|uniref:Uncharacterized protein n=1 Tax=Arachidicoccus ginsenosidivorans TaxID=496057 RepID=A0A5B8VTF0_9BACT|nr:hypothetical protein [Arachidicoccus ginsenosidivorans]QEC73428.1 hypothetical protein FSB73_18945 [Arachidicoccus ginsenosidivorans]